MPDINGTKKGRINFKRFARKADYLVLGQYDETSLYFIDDTEELFMGKNPYGVSIEYGQTLPSPLFKNKLYIITNGGVTRFYTYDGSAAVDLTGIFPAASLTARGIVRLNNAINESDETAAATSKAVKTVYDNLSIRLEKIEQPPQIQRILLGQTRDYGFPFYEAGYIGMPIVIHLDRPAPANCYIQPLRYSKKSGAGNTGRGGNDNRLRGRRNKAAFRPIDLHQVNKVYGANALQTLRIPQGATRVSILSPRYLYRPVRIRGNSTYKNKYPAYRNLYIAISNSGNRCLYRFQTAIYGGIGSGIYRAGIPSSDVLEISVQQEAPGIQRTIARISFPGM